MAADKVQKVCCYFNVSHVKPMDEMEKFCFSHGYARACAECLEKVSEGKPKCFGCGCVFIKQNIWINDRIQYLFCFVCTQIAIDDIYKYDHVGWRFLTDALRKDYLTGDQPDMALAGDRRLMDRLFQTMGTYYLTKHRIVREGLSHLIDLIDRFLKFENIIDEYKFILALSAKQIHCLSSQEIHNHDAFMHAYAGTFFR
jgi:hypothetical protein